MADNNTIHSLTSTLASQPMSTQGSEQQHPQQHPQHIANPAELQNHPGMPPMGMAPPPPPPAGPVEGASPEQPVKRRPGRPKGSGKKPVDPNAPPKIKRPVGRPRKDGLPAGSVGTRRTSRPRKRPPGTFASGPHESTPGFGYGVSTLCALRPLRRLIEVRSALPGSVRRRCAMGLSVCTALGP